jgi:polar amino acid transport system substrate-binding protein
MKRRTLLGAGAAGLLTGLLGFVAPALAADSVISQINGAKTIKVGVGTFVPWSFPNKDGKLIGFEVDVANKLADDLGVKLELVPTVWDAIIPSLVAGKYDVIIGGLTITDERAKTVDFTIPYEHSLTYAVVNKKLAPDISTLAQLDAPTVTFANRRGASASSATYFPKSQSLAFDDENTQEQEFLNGNVTALTVSTPTQALLAEDHPDVVRIIEPPITQTNEAFAVRKGDPDTLAAFNQWIKTHTDDGWLQARFDYWFKGRSWKDQVASK